jgi:putative ABC transport system substrate-binding protein
VCALGKLSCKDFERIGYIEGHNIAIEHRYAEDSDEASKAANEFVGLRVDVIIVVGTLAALAAKRATSSIPIVGLNMADPKRSV